MSNASNPIIRAGIERIEDALVDPAFDNRIPTARREAVRLLREALYETIIFTYFLPEAGAVTHIRAIMACVVQAYAAENKTLEQRDVGVKRSVSAVLTKKPVFEAQYLEGASISHFKNLRKYREGEPRKSADEIRAMIEAME